MNKRAFTLLETIVAIGLIVGGLVGTLALVAQSTRDVRGADNRLIAAQLAQESIEVVVAIRDTNWIQGHTANALTRNIRTTQRGIVNYNSTAVQQVNQNQFCLLRNAEGYYVHGTPATCTTLFRRHLEIADGTDSAGTVYREVRAVVEWQVGTRTESVTTVHHLYNWYE